MAWALKFDGVNDYLTVSLSNPISANQPFEIEVRMTVPSNYGRPFGSSAGNNSRLLIFSSTNEVRLTDSLGSNASFTAPAYTKSDYNTFKFVRDNSGNVDFYLNDVFVSTKSGLTGAFAVNQLGRQSTAGYTKGNIEFIRFSEGGTDRNHWDATASSHAAGNPILIDTVSGENATGVNMPTDGSAWIDLGGGAENSAGITSNMPSLLSSAAFSHVAPVGFNASISSTLPSLTSSANFTQTLPEFDASVSSNMPSLLSAANLTNTAPGYNATIASVMPSMISASNVTVTTPQSGAAISSTMPSMLSLSSVTVTPPQTGVAIASNMPSLVSSGNFTQALPAAGVVVSSTMPSMVSASVFAQTVPEFDSSIASTMPSMVSSSTIQNLTPGNNSAIASLMPALTSSATLTIDEPVTLDATIASTMPSLQSSATVYNGVISVVIGEGNNINIVVKSRNLNILTKSRNI